MSDLKLDWRPVGAWAGLAAAAAQHGRSDVAPGVTVTLIDHTDMATLIRVENETARFAAAVKELWGLDVPASGRASANAVCTLVWSGPDQWLAAPKVYDFVSIVGAFDGVAAASEQGDGRALVEIGGRAARDTLAKGLSIDLHPAAFMPGCAAVTGLSHLSVQVWQTDDRPTFVLSVPRSVAGHVFEWLLESSAEFGCEIQRRPTL